MGGEYIASGALRGTISRRLARARGAALVERLKAGAVTAL
jgi:hypothetical protein